MPNAPFVPVQGFEAMHSILTPAGFRAPPDTMAPELVSSLQSGGDGKLILERHLNGAGAREADRARRRAGGRTTTRSTSSGPARGRVKRSLSDSGTSTPPAGRFTFA
jgi:hypothetical protein